MLNKNCFSINTYLELEKLIRVKKNNKNKLIIHIKNYLIRGFGIEWLNTLIELVSKNYPKNNIKFYVDAGDDQGLSILILREKIHYLKLRSNKTILNKINQIAKKNKVLLNPDFNVIDLSKIKNYNRIKI